MKYSTTIIFLFALFLSSTSLLAESAPINKNENLNSSSSVLKNYKNQKALERVQKRLERKQERLEKRIAKKDGEFDKNASIGFICGLLGIILPLAIVGFIFSAKALGNIKKNPELKGEGLAVFGLIFSLFWILMILGSGALFNA